MAKQGRLLETMAINELDNRRKRLEEYQIKARFALAESYDRATKAALDSEIEKQRELQKNQAAVATPAVNYNAVLPTESMPELTTEVPQITLDNSSVSDDVPKGAASSFKEKLLSR